MDENTKQQIDDFKNRFPDLTNKELLDFMYLQIAKRLGMDVYSVDKEDMRRFKKIKRIANEALTYNVVLDDICEQIDFLLENQQSKE